MKRVRAWMTVSALLLVLPLSTGASELGGPGWQCVTPNEDMVWVPGGRTIIGDDQGYVEERPAYAATVKGFWMDRHEVTNAQFARFVSATDYVTVAERAGESVVFRPPGPGARPTQPGEWWKLVSGANWRHPDGPGSDLKGRADMPVVHVAYADALAYARWRGHSLPSEEQFERAAQGNAGPGRDQPSPDAANTWQGSFPTFNSGADGRRGLAPVGCYKANAYGLNDMIGNAWEWTDSLYLPSHGPMLSTDGAPTSPSFDPAQPDARVRVIKGGSFLCAPNYCARYRPAARHAQDESLGASHLGFRTIDRMRPAPI